MLSRLKSKLPFSSLAEEAATDYVPSVKMTEEGRQALLRLTKGDMRRALNVLQACHAAYDITGETEVYNCTGNPHPSDIETIVNSMLTDEFTTAYNSGCEPCEYCNGR
jgi:DNA polymerase III delta prime subunit